MLVFGKTMENVRDYVDVKLACNESYMLKWVGNPSIQIPLYFQPRFGRNYASKINCIIFANQFQWDSLFLHCQSTSCTNFSLQLHQGKI